MTSLLFGKKEYEAIISELQFITDNQHIILESTKEISEKNVSKEEMKNYIQSLEDRMCTIGEMLNVIVSQFKQTSKEINDHRKFERVISSEIEGLRNDINEMKKSGERNVQRLNEALNMVMIQNLLDRAETIDLSSNCSRPQKSDERHYTETCPTCGKPITNSDGICNICGSKVNGKEDFNTLDETKSCPVCGSLVLKRDCNCVHCGHKFSDNLPNYPNLIARIINAKKF